MLHSLQCSIRLQKHFYLSLKYFFHLSISYVTYGFIKIVNFNIRKILLENYKISGNIGAAYRIKAVQENGVRYSVWQIMWLLKYISLDYIYFRRQPLYLAR